MYAVGAQDPYVDYSEKPSLPMFWSGGGNDEGATAAFFGVFVLGAGFGAIHLIAWYSEFPSRAELILWRVACIALTALPLTPHISAPALFLATLINENWEDAAGVVLSVVLALLVPLYLAGRIVTLLIALTALRSLPDGAFITVDWTTFFPHI